MRVCEYLAEDIGAEIRDIVHNELDHVTSWTPQKNLLEIHCKDHDITIVIGMYDVDMTTRKQDGEIISQKKYKTLGGLRRGILSKSDIIRF